MRQTANSTTPGSMATCQRSPGIGSSVTEAACYFAVDQSTIRRDIQRGCPVLCRGSRGPGRGARLDLREVAAWRGRASGQVGLTPDQVLQRLAAALLSALEENHLDVRADISREAAAAALLVVWQNCCETFGVTFRFDENPAAIRALMREL